MTELLTAPSSLPGSITYRRSVPAGPHAEVAEVPRPSRGKPLRDDSAVIKAQGALAPHPRPPDRLIAPLAGRADQRRRQVGERRNPSGQGEAPTGRPGLMVREKATGRCLGTLPPVRRHMTAPFGGAVVVRGGAPVPTAHACHGLGAVLVLRDDMLQWLIGSGWPDGVRHRTSFADDSDCGCLGGLDLDGAGTARA